MQSVTPLGGSRDVVITELYGRAIVGWPTGVSIARSAACLKQRRIFLLPSFRFNTKQFDAESTTQDRQRIVNKSSNFSVTRQTEVNGNYHTTKTTLRYIHRIRQSKTAIFPCER